MSTVGPSSDPARIKALAHPIRLALLEYLATVPEATATQCAAKIGESVASCSFHLRTLAKHGYIEQAESSDSKSKPWRIVDPSQENTFDQTVPESLPALSNLGSAVLVQVNHRINEILTALPTLPNEAIERTTLANISLWLTDQEHGELMEKLMDLMEPFTSRVRLEDRPEDAKLSRIFLASTPELSDYLSKDQ